MESLGLTWIHLDTLGLTWTHLDSLGLTWIHLDSPQLTRSHLNSLDLTRIHENHTKLQRNTILKRQKGKGKGPGRLDFLQFPPHYQTARTHARTKRTKRNDFPVELPPNLRCFASFWVTRKWLCSFGNMASRASRTPHCIVVDIGPTQACYRAAWTSASSGILLLQMASWSTRPKKISKNSIWQAPKTNSSGNGSRGAGKSYRKCGMPCRSVQPLQSKGIAAKDPTTTWTTPNRKCWRDTKRAWPRKRSKTSQYQR